MTSRARYIIATVAIIVVAVVALAIAIVPSVAGKQLLTDVQVTPRVISPNGDLLDDECNISYTLAKRATVRVTLTDAGGKLYVLRDSQTRTADSYAIAFNGAIAVNDGPDYRVLPDGAYSGQVEVVADDGEKASAGFELTVENADTVAPTISGVTVYPDTFSPNGDALEDEAAISYSLSKKATAQIYVEDKNGGFHLLAPPKELDAAIQSFTWDGRENGGTLLVDGVYTYHIRATDKAGNVSETSGNATIDNGGTPRLEITKAIFKPTTIPLSGTVQVQITVKNTGDTIIKWDDSMGPPPGTQYTTDMTYGYWQDSSKKPLYYERPGVWRVGVMWNNSPMTYPARWAIGKTLAPGDETTIIGEIVVLQRQEEIYFWASVEQGGIGFPGGQKGNTRVKVSY